MADTNLPANENGIIRGWHVLVGFICFFGVIFAVNFYMAWNASNSWSGLVVKNSYVASQQFNTRLAAAKRQKDLGWHSTIGYLQGELIFKLRDANGKPVILDQVSVTVGHPVELHEDQTLQLEYKGEGQYSAPLALSQGEWLYTLEGMKDGEPYRLEDRIRVGN